MNPVVDVSFRVLGGSIPADHGYALYSAISRLLPKLHGDAEMGIHAINGRNVGDRVLELTESSRLIVRIGASRIKDILPLAGTTIDLDGHKLRVGSPSTHALIPATQLYSRLVVIKGFMDPEGFLEATVRQLKEIAVKGKPKLIDTSEAARANEALPRGTHSPVLRRTLRIRDKMIVGFALLVDELVADESIRLQERGLGGRRRFGCGMFVPAKTRNMN
jgi:CRISPR-associated protein Cas6